MLCQPCFLQAYDAKEYEDKLLKQSWLRGRGMHSASIRHHIDHDRTWDDGLDVEGEDEVELAAGREYIIRMLDKMRAAMVIQVCRAGEGRAAFYANFDHLKIHQS